MGQESPCNTCRRRVEVFTHEVKTMPQDEGNMVRVYRETMCGYCGQLIKRETIDVKQK